MLLAYTIYTLVFVFTMSLMRLSVKINRNSNVIENNEIWPIWYMITLFYTLTIGTRENVGIDYLSYKYHFLLVESSNNFLTKDLIYYLFLPIVNNYGYNWFILFLAFITIWYFLQIMKENIHIVVWCFFFFFGLGIFFLSLNIMRQTAASFIIFYSITKFLKKDYISFSFHFIFALVIHKAGIIVLPLLFIVQRDILKSVKLQLVLFFICLTCGNFFFNNILSLLTDRLSFLNLGQYNYYIRNIDYVLAKTARNYSEANSTGLFVLLLIVVDTVAIYFSPLLKSNYNKNGFILFYNLYYIGIILHPILLSHETGVRLASYFVFYRFYIYATLFHFIFKSRNNILLRVFCIYVLISCIAYYYVTIYRCRMEIAPYQFIFNFF
ncbi:EpsG family protein [Desulfotalea psychrophila]|uniref:Related to capsular polysaccharide biosynthesis protein n=1 Tax=Desulfotalea psychrophila (strain LSv54 / DSM 12343) TaxID=177439 RepID=Q6AIA7_DESPS|nr:related to capsular polysaccharide biosynthesis protein [Desulfotalea psychrophila LSv54]